MQTFNAFFQHNYAN